MDNIVDKLVDKWYKDCLIYDIPVSPSDVKDIVENLILTKHSKKKTGNKVALKKNILRGGSYVR